MADCLQKQIPIIENFPLNLTAQGDLSLDLRLSFGGRVRVVAATFVRSTGILLGGLRAFVHIRLLGQLGRLGGLLLNLIQLGRLCTSIGAGVHAGRVHIIDFYRAISFLI